MPSQARRIIINAEDVGMHPAVDNGVAMLAEWGVVTSVSVMALGDPDRSVLDALRHLGVSVGLHLDLTSAHAQARYGYRCSVRDLVVAAWRRQLRPQQVRDVLRDQFHRFGELAGTLPAFVDGREHVHQFPVIRDALLAVLEEQGYPSLYVRNTLPRRWRGLRAALVGALGAATLNGDAKRAGLASNGDFFGVYNRSVKADLPRMWRAWLASAPPAGALAMCHPALPHPSLEPFRQREYYFLASSQFADLMEEHGAVATAWEAV